MDNPRHQSTPARATNPLDEPFFWRVASGVLYAEMPYSRSVRPPLLSEWESQRVECFRNPARRSQWLAGRALAKALVRERLGISGIVEIRERADGQPLVYRGGMPLTDVWLGLAYRHGRVAAVIADRPVALDIRRVDPELASVVTRFADRGELRSLRRVFAQVELACGVAWAVKEAALRAVRSSGASLGSVRVAPDFSVVVGDVRLHTLALRVVDHSVVAIVARPLLNERPVTRIVMHDDQLVEAPSRLHAAVERSVARARRVAEARARWQRLRWQS